MQSLSSANAPADSKRCWRSMLGEAGPTLCTALRGRSSVELSPRF